VREVREVEESEEVAECWEAEQHSEEHGEEGEVAAAWEQEDGPPRKCEVANGVVGPGTEWRFGKDRAQPAYPRNTCSG